MSAHNWGSSSFEKELSACKALLKEQRDTINLLNRKLYGRKSERSHAASSSSGTTQEALPSKPSAGKAKEEPSTLRKPYRRPERRDYEGMEERLEILMPDAEELKGARFVRSEKTCRLYMIPARIVKVIYDRRIYARNGKLIVPKLPYVPENFQKRHIGPSLMAELLTNKFCYHIPIHRQKAMFRNAGADIALSTLYDWCGEGIDALEGLYQSIREAVLKADYLNVDETTVTVVDEERRHARKEYMWGLVDNSNRLAFFDYEQNSNPKKKGSPKTARAFIK